jgi:hypothetical protein
LLFLEIAMTYRAPVKDMLFVMQALAGLAQVALPGGPVGAILVVSSEAAGAVRVLTANLDEETLAIEPGEGVET